MITTTDIGDILFKKCEPLGIQRYHKDAYPTEELSEERVVVIVKDKNSDGRYWERCFVEVNICVPDRQGMKDRKRLGELEKAAMELFAKEVSSSHDGTTYRYRRSSTGVNSDPSLRIHFINTRILFESQKVI